MCIYRTNVILIALFVVTSETAAISNTKEQTNEHQQQPKKDDQS